MDQVSRHYQEHRVYLLYHWVQSVLSLLASQQDPWVQVLPWDQRALWHPWIQQLQFHLSGQLFQHDPCGPSGQEAQVFQENLEVLLIQGIQLLQYFLICPLLHLRLLSLKGPQVPFVQVDPCALDHQHLQGVLVGQIDQVFRWALEVLWFQPLPVSHLAWPEVLFFHQTLRPSGLPGPRGALEVQEVLLHRADLVYQALHRNPQVHAVQAFLCVHEVLSLRASRELP